MPVYVPSQHPHSNLQQGQEMPSVCEDEHTGTYFFSDIHTDSSSIRDKRAEREMERGGSPVSLVLSRGSNFMEFH